MGLDDGNWDGLDVGRIVGEMDGDPVGFCVAGLSVIRLSPTVGFKVSESNGDFDGFDDGI